MSRGPVADRVPVLALALTVALGAVTAGCTRSHSAPRTPPVDLPRPQPPRDVLEPRDRVPDEQVEPLAGPEASAVPSPEPEIAAPEPREASSRPPEPTSDEPPAQAPALAVEMAPEEARRLAREVREIWAATEERLAGLEAPERERHATSIDLILELVEQSKRALERGDPELAHHLALKARALAGDL